MRTNLISFIIPLVTLTLTQCSTGVDPTPLNNLLPNGEFESNGQGSLVGWDVEPSYPSSVTFSSDVPPGGGTNSIKLMAGWPPGDIRTVIPAVYGTHLYRLTAWGKMAPGSTAGGKIWIAKLKTGSALNEYSTSFPDTGWVSRSIGTTITAEVGDSIGVTLRAAYWQSAQGFSYFDRMTLEIIE